MRKITTLIADAQRLVADLEMRASEVEDRDGFVPDRMLIVSNLRSAAGGVQQAMSRVQP